MFAITQIIIHRLYQCKKRFLLQTEKTNTGNRRWQARNIGLFVTLCVTYIRNVRDAPADPLGRAGRAALALTGAAQVFQPGFSPRSEAIGKIASAGVWVSFEEALSLKPSEITVKRAPVRERSKKNVNVVRS
jgi:hypothetical protein